MKNVSAGTFKQSFPTGNVWRAYAIRPYPGTSRLFFLSYMYPANFPGLGEALIFFCFFSCIKTRKEDKSLPKTRRVLLYDELQSPKPAGGACGPQRSFTWYPGKTSLPRQGPCLDGRKEAKEDQGLTEAEENGRVRVGIEKGAGFWGLRFIRKKNLTTF